MNRAVTPFRLREPDPQAARGFTLVELLIANAISR